ncbi:hypothetical protein HDU93_002225 [Gonapodya sp. JEL0774]|nr:hypothetical protein HDU93_002225 [Gonapodya sp. JEL0774]
MDSFATVFRSSRFTQVDPKLPLLFLAPSTPAARATGNIGLKRSLPPAVNVSGHQTVIPHVFSVRSLDTSADLSTEHVPRQQIADAITRWRENFPAETEPASLRYRDIRWESPRKVDLHHMSPERFAWLLRRARDNSEKWHTYRAKLESSSGVRASEEDMLRFLRDECGVEVYGGDSPDSTRGAGEIPIHGPYYSHHLDEQDSTQNHALSSTNPPKTDLLGMALGGTSTSTSTPSAITDIDALLGNLMVSYEPPVPLISVEGRRLPARNDRDRIVRRPKTLVGVAGFVAHLRVVNALEIDYARDTLKQFEVSEAHWEAAPDDEAVWRAPKRALRGKAIIEREPDHDWRGVGDVRPKISLRLPADRPSRLLGGIRSKSEAFKRAAEAAARRADGALGQGPSLLRMAEASAAGFGVQSPTSGEPFGDAESSNSTNPTGRPRRTLSGASSLRESTTALLGEDPVMSRLSRFSKSAGGKNGGRKNGNN